MVRGVDRFKDYFKNYTGQYTLIGGAACDIILGKLGEDFQATKDIDMVLILEELQEDFVSTFIRFVKEGGYEHIDKGSGETQFFRFSKPKDMSFPYMIELFSKKPDYLGSLASRLGPIHISDEVMSLSAILLDDAYYDVMKSGITVVDDVSVLNIEHIVLFKMKAWLDLSERKENGELIDSKTIRKHKNDILRLSASFDKDMHLRVLGQVKADAELFMEKIKNDSIDLKNLDIRNVTYEELLNIIATCYGL